MSGIPTFRLAQFQRVLQQLPDCTDAVHLPTGIDDPLDAVGTAINALAERLARRRDQDARLWHVSRQVLDGVALDEVLDQMYESFRSLIPYDRIGCALLEDGGRILRARWARSEFATARLERGYAARMAGSSLARILETGEPRIINDLAAYAVEHPMSHATSLVLAEGVRASLTCPLIAQGRAIGFLFFSSRQVGTYAALHRDIFMRLAELISGVVEKSALYEQLAQKNEALRVAHEILQEQAARDPLTGLWNRGAILASLESHVAQAAGQVRPCSVALIDVDHFKRINDTHGHLAGDAVLREVATRMADAMRGTDRVGRWGGEEFLVVLGDRAPGEARAIAEHVARAVRDTPMLVNGTPLWVTVSVGVAHRDGRAHTNADALLARADAALYAAKRAGRDRVEDADGVREIGITQQQEGTREGGSTQRR